MASNFVTGLKSAKLDRMMRSTAGAVRGRIQFPTTEFLSAIDRQMTIVLKRIGGKGRKEMRILLNKKPPKKPKKTHMKRSGRATKAYRNYRRKIHSRRPPFKRKGTLRALTLFAWKLATLEVVVGPVHFKSKRVKPKGQIRTVPELLDQGGAAMMNFRDPNGNKIHQPKRVQYRQFEYVQPALKKTTPWVKDIMESTPLR